MSRLLQTQAGDCSARQGGVGGAAIPAASIEHQGEDDKRGRRARTFGNMRIPFLDALLAHADEPPSIRRMLSAVTGWMRPRSVMRAAINSCGVTSKAGL